MHPSPETLWRGFGLQVPFCCAVKTPPSIQGARQEASSPGKKTTSWSPIREFLLSGFGARTKTLSLRRSGRGPSSASAASRRARCSGPCLRSESDLNTPNCIDWCLGGRGAQRARHFWSLFRLSLASLSLSLSLYQTPTWPEERFGRAHCSGPCSNGARHMGSTLFMELGFRRQVPPGPAGGKTVTEARG